MSLRNIFKKRIKSVKPQHKYSNQLIYKFTDLGGHHYFQHPDDTLLSIDRMGKMHEFFIWITRGMSDTQHSELIDLAIEADIEFKKTGKNPGKLPAILHELDRRKTFIAPADVYYNYLAIGYIREDEQHELFNEQIHDEKINAFKEGAKDIGSFFFRLPELTNLLKYTRFTTEKWPEFIQASKIMEQEHESVLKYFRSKS